VTTIATPDADSAARQDLLERYARLAIRVGINLEPGGEVAIRAMIEQTFARLTQLLDQGLTAMAPVAQP
jgi:leucyl aminopeptidase (aminopeptidase T)